jgi:hypothetical protein
MMLEIKDPDGIEYEKHEKQLQEFPVKSALNLSYEEFFKNFMLANQPCLIKDLIQDWPAMKDFVNADDQEPNIDFFEKLLNDSGRQAEEMLVPVADCQAKYFNSQEKCQMQLGQYLSWWRNRDQRSLYLKGVRIC